jgi:hypothetical protein
MAQPDPLDDALTDLAQAFADIGLILNIVRELRRNADRLRDPLKDELGHLIPLMIRAMNLL